MPKTVRRSLKDTSPVSLDEVEEPPSKRQRSAVACKRCHDHKVKCTGGNPCNSCAQQPPGTECVYPKRDRKVPVQESYLNWLEQEVKLLRGGKEGSEEDAVRQESQTQYTPETVEEDGDYAERIGNVDVNLKNPLMEDKAWFVTDSASWQPIYIGEAACTAFGTRLRQFLNGNDPVAPLSRSKYSKHKAFLRMSAPRFQLPNRAYAHLLLKVALRFLGNDYHLMLRKSTIEKMEELYRTGSLDDTVFLCKLFALFSMGEMYANRRLGSTKGSDIPGTGFFVQAMSLTQDMHEEPSVVYVEALLIIALYSLALNRTRSAYTYAGMALRLCLTLGLHHNVPEGYAISPVERENRIRVWWSVYIIDRITSSKLGHPVTVQDSDIDVDLPSMEKLSPTEQEEFSDPSHIIAHVKLARISGDIMSDIYGRSNQAKAFVQSVQKILRNLRSWAETLPESVQISPSQPFRYASRNVASLHLCFNQCVILTTRPILFHVFKSCFQGQGAPTASPTTMALADACIHAARSSNGLLTQLWIDGGMAIFGYFDSHYLFSSTIILMMSSILGTHNSDADREAADTASDIMESLVKDGNLPAAGFYEHFLEIRKTLLEFTERGHSNGPVQLMEHIPEPVMPENDINNEFLNQTLLGDPSIQHFLTQADFQYGFPMGMEMAGNMLIPRSSLFE
ncbi:C6 transcription factor, putative [Talaromyces stipitatus ATCC 10500]|uniref:C6 transcription factor, putative n=1 Tax=Talaromyces stipitatus (strain ATCC 10500 / CBS 375.48 / QM 6759 / NRRL 1006) TaxID=441959 RepID=B8MA94_TALSN|nr:C6 transcription factor, putative [Talaromyces stipitatus ATCC 10500]EED18596.1 C6 transcription factor, putative [Talaromyces stipitatus ATCC 10500]